MADNRPIGLYDSGVGGLSVVREVFAQLPGESVIYFGDTARVPYGPRPAGEILSFNREIIDWQVQLGAKLILIACNTSCAVALEALQADCPVPLLGLIGPGAESALGAGRRVGVIATEGTVRSGAYGRALRALDPSAEVCEVACPPLVPLVEAGAWEGPEAEAVVRQAIAPHLLAPPDCLLLGCTHYPHLAPLLSRLLGPGVTLVDPAARAVARAGELLAARDALATAPPSHRFFVSGDPEPFYQLASRMFPGCVAGVEQVAWPPGSRRSDVSSAAV